jgi:hypothetical protein
MFGISHYWIGTLPARTYRSPMSSMSGETRRSSKCAERPVSTSSCTRSSALSINIFLPHAASESLPQTHRLIGARFAPTEREVLSRHRKALMLFGVFHLLHGGGPGQGDAVTRYERDYPGKTFVIIEGGEDGTGDEPLGDAKAPAGVSPSLLQTKNSRIGSLSLSSILQSPSTTDGRKLCRCFSIFGSSEILTGRTPSSGYRS